MSKISSMFGAASLFLLCGCQGAQTDLATAPPGVVKSSDQASKPADDAYTLKGSAASLTVGSPAPKLQFAEWVKGKPVTELEKGKVYVVEFWATWCGPCKETIPHLSELAKKYGDKVTFIGADVLETQEGGPASEVQAKVASYVKGMGSQMDYNVARDDAKNSMAVNWLQAAGQNGIPVAFVIGQDGKIAYIDHPAKTGMVAVIDQLLAGKFDMAKAQADTAPAPVDKAALQQMSEKLGADMQAHKYVEVVADCDELVKLAPQAAGRIAPVKYEALLASDPKAAMAFGRELADGPIKGQPSSLSMLAFAMVRSGTPLPGADLNLASQWAQRAVDLSKSDLPVNAMAYNTLALVQHGQGNKAEAIRSEEKSLAELKTIKKNPPPATLLAQLSKRLTSWKKGA